ncbi:Isochorismatase hydrolase [Mycena floridula]|nr:Isochorismatase hydrolase [Mycena floridula]
MSTRPKVPSAIQYGNDSSFWIEYPSGLVDLSRASPLGSTSLEAPEIAPGQFEFKVEGGRTVRVDAKKTALVVIDMQNFFLHPDLRDHPTGLKCVDPIMKSLPSLREKGVKILWVNWGLTDHELKTIPPALIRAFRKNDRPGFGGELPGGFGRLLMRDAYNSELYGPLQNAYIEGQKAGTDFWIHKNRMSALGLHQTALGLFLEQEGLTTLLFAGVNADQCVLGSLVDAYYQGYDCILLEDATATTSPGIENVFYNAAGAYGFLTDTTKLCA